MSAITASHLYKIFGRRPERGVAALQGGATRDDLREDGLTPAVIDASFEVQPGEIFVVMGLSGSGKSTLIRMVNGLLEPTAGDLLIGDRNITHLSPQDLRRVRRDKISMVFQHFALLPTGRWARTLRMPWRSRGSAGPSGSSAPRRPCPWWDSVAGDRPCPGSCPEGCASAGSRPGACVRHGRDADG